MVIPFDPDSKGPHTLTHLTYQTPPHTNLARTGAWLSVLAFCTFMLLPVSLTLAAVSVGLGVHGLRHARRHGLSTRYASVCLVCGGTLLGLVIIPTAFSILVFGGPSDLDLIIPFL